MSSLEGCAARLTTIVEAHFRGMDASHDFLHVERVRTTALRLARDEGLTDPEDLAILELGALSHDLGDRKYSADGLEDTGVVIRALEAAGVPAPLVSRVVAVVQGVSYTGEVAAEASGSTLPSTGLVGAIVQDADRLDAIGAVGESHRFDTLPFFA